MNYEDELRVEIVDSLLYGWMSRYGNLQFAGSKGIVRFTKKYSLFHRKEVWHIFHC
jgi:hypothetical protein